MTRKKQNESHTLRHEVLLHLRIIGDDFKTFSLALSDNQPIEGVLVIEWQGEQRFQIHVVKRK